MAGIILSPFRMTIFNGTERQAEQSLQYYIPLPTWKCLSFEISNHTKKTSSISSGQLKILYLRFNWNEEYAYIFLPTFVKWRLPMYCIYPVFMTGQYSLQSNRKCYFNTYNKRNEIFFPQSSSKKKIFIINSVGQLCPEKNQNMI